MTTSTKSKPAEILPQSVLRHLPAPAPDIRRRVLYFMRAVDSSTCKSHAERLAALADTLRELKADVIVFAPPGGPFESRLWIEQLPFPVVVTHDGLETAGFRRALGAVQRSGTLVIGLDGDVRLAHRSTVPFAAFNERQLLAYLRDNPGG